MIKTLFAVLALLVLSSNTLAEAPAQAGLCVTCHGNAGISVTGEWPSLAGQKKAYLIEQITAFRDGTRSNSLMAPMVANLSDGDIGILAAYYSALPISIATSGDAKLVASGHNSAAYCTACHGARGVTANEEWPNLAGQQAPYMINQLNAFKSGDRNNDLMHIAISGLDEEDFAGLAAYFSQLKP